MFRTATSLMAALAILVGAVVSSSSIFAGAEPEFEITASTIDAGGGTSSGPGFELTGTIGQPEANAQYSSGGEFLLAGGFWARATDRIFFNGFE